MWRPHWILRETFLQSYFNDRSQILFEPFNLTRRKVGLREAGRLFNFVVPLQTCQRIESQFKRKYRKIQHYIWQLTPRDRKQVVLTKLYKKSTNHRNSRITKEISADLRSTSSIVYHLCDASRAFVSRNTWTLCRLFLKLVLLVSMPSAVRATNDQQRKFCGTIHVSVNSFTDEETSNTSKTLYI